MVSLSTTSALSVQKCCWVIVKAGDIQQWVNLQRVILIIEIHEIQRKSVKSVIH